MRDFLEGTHGARSDPMRSAAAAADRALPKRFYDAATAVQTDAGWELRLDGRPARTPGRNPLALPDRETGEAVAAEWGAQGAHIDPLSMPLTRLANSAIDGVQGREDAVRDDISAYAGSDLLCYRAAEPDGLVVRQASAWDAPLDAISRRLGVRFTLTEGLMPVEQPDAALAAVRGAMAEIEDPFRLAALHVATTLTGSALLSLAVDDGSLASDDAWSAAHVDEDWNRELWGADEEADARRAKRKRDFDAAVFILRRA